MDELYYETGGVPRYSLKSPYDAMFVKCHYNKGGVPLRYIYISTLEQFHKMCKECNSFQNSFQENKKPKCSKTSSSYSILLFTLQYRLKIFSRTACYI